MSKFIFFLRPQITVESVLNKSFQVNLVLESQKACGHLMTIKLYETYNNNKIKNNQW